MTKTSQDPETSDLYFLIAKLLSKTPPADLTKGIPDTMSTSDFVDLVSDLITNEDHAREMVAQYLREENYPSKIIDNQVVWLVNRTV